MNSVAPPSPDYVKTRVQLERARERLIARAYRAHKRGDDKDASELFDEVIALDVQLASA